LVAVTTLGPFTVAAAKYTSHWHDGRLDVPAVAVYSESILFAAGVVTILLVVATPRDVQRIDGLISPEPLNVTLHVYCIVSDSAAVFAVASKDDVNESELLANAKSIACLHISTPNSNPSKSLFERVTLYKSTYLQILTSLHNVDAVHAVDLVCLSVPPSIC